jgi:chorismate mutase
MIKEVSQQAMDLNYDGLMIETHNDPENAWSDADQQVTPQALKQIIQELVIRKASVEEEDFNSDMVKLRAKIDIADSKILELLGNRMKVAEEIGAIKKAKNVSVLQNKRWSEILEKMVADGEEKGLSEEFILKLFKAIHQESISHQEKIMNHSSN